MGMVQLYGNVFDLAHSYQEFGHMQCTPVTVHPRSEDSRAISFRVTSDDTRPAGRLPSRRPRSCGQAGRV